jgi:hypothetical protein
MKPQYVLPFVIALLFIIDGTAKEGGILDRYSKRSTAAAPAPGYAEVENHSTVPTSDSVLEVFASPSDAEVDSETVVTVAATKPSVRTEFVSRSQSQVGRLSDEQLGVEKPKVTI